MTYAADQEEQEEEDIYWRTKMTRWLEKKREKVAQIKAKRDHARKQKEGAVHPRGQPAGLPQVQVDARPGGVLLTARQALGGECSTLTFRYCDCIVTYIQ